MTEGAVDVDVYGARPTFAHLIAQGYTVGILSGVGIGKDGLAEQLSGVRVNEEPAIVARQHEIGIRIR